MSSSPLFVASLAVTGLIAAWAPAALASDVSLAPAAAAPHRVDIGDIIRRVGVASAGPQDEAPAGRLIDYVNGFPQVAGAPAPEQPVALEDRTAEATATPVVAAQSATCDSYFTQSQALTTSLSSVFAAVTTKDAVTMTLQLPGLDKQLSALPATEIAPEVCGGDHINAYTSYQYFELSSLRDRGLDTGFPADLPLVKQPDLNQAALAYIVGWIKFEKSDFDGALAAYGKGLAMYPHSHDLQHEYLATLINLKRGADVVAFAEKELEHTHDLDDAARANLFTARGVGLIMIGQFDAADESFGVSLLYNYTDETKGYQDELRDARSKAGM